jgi:CheY-like chemotaxis protein/nitrogen-specific signal transduction histidine kinase/HPt (histidine-containing phosphotransfer) domain-containing protein
MSDDGSLLLHLLGMGGHWVWSLDGAGRLCPPDAANLTPAPSVLGAVTGRPFIDLMDDRVRADQAAIRGALATGEAFSGLVWRARLPPPPSPTCGTGSGERIVSLFGDPEPPAPAAPVGPWFRCGAVPRMPGNPTGGWLGLCHPIDREKSLERRLAETEARAAASTQAKYRFLATMSHELRTPMTSILGASQLLADTDGPHDREQSLFLKTIHEAGHTMMGVLNDIIDLAKVEDGKLDPAPEPARLSVLVDGVMVIMAGSAETKGLTLAAKVDPTLPPILSFDVPAVRRILLNLIGNAIKFTAAGSVTLDVQLVHRIAKNKVRLTFTVTDTGIGIPKALHDAIFDPFAQVDPLVSRGVGGSGLGLTISRRLAETMGGQLAVTSATGRGSAFTLTLDLQIPTDIPRVEGETAPKPPKRRRPLRILLAEDVALNRTILTRLIERDGHRVCAVGNGAAAVAALAMDQFDLVLMDSRMPGMDGLEATRRIRVLPDRTKATLPILALTANVLPEEAALFHEAGMDGILHKPLDMEAFYGALADLFEADGLGAPAPASPPAVASPRAPKTDHVPPSWSPPPASAPNPDEETPLVDGEMIATYLEIFGIDGVLDLVKVFEAQGTGMAQSLRDHLREGAMDSLIDTAHRLTSASGSLALTRLRTLARQAEDAARDGRFADLDPLINRIPLVVAQSLSDLDRRLARLRSP